MKVLCPRNKIPKIIDKYISSIMYSSAPRIPRPWSCGLGIWSAVELDEEGLELGPHTWDGGNSQCEWVIVLYGDQLTSGLGGGWWRGV